MFKGRAAFGKNIIKQHDVFQFKLLGWFPVQLIKLIKQLSLNYFYEQLRVDFKGRQLCT